MNPALPGDSSESNSYSPVPYGEEDALCFKAERDESRLELGEVSKKAYIAEIKWEDQRKQLLATIDGISLRSIFKFNSLFDTNRHCYCNFAAHDAELDQLKMLVEQLADKVNARGNTPAERLAAVEDRVDEVATHDIRLGTTLGLAAMATHTGVDYSIQPRSFQGRAPEDIDEIEVILERLDGHGDVIAELTHPQSVLNRLFD
jgi:thymidylate synthase